jgi:hypothetical protein
VLAEVRAEEAGPSGDDCGRHVDNVVERSGPGLPRKIRCAPARRTLPSLEAASAALPQPYSQEPGAGTANFSIERRIPV